MYVLALEAVSGGSELIAIWFACWLHQNALEHSLLRVFSNEITFDETSGSLVRFNERIIHSLNKDARALTASPFWCVRVGVASLCVCLRIECVLRLTF